MKDTYDLIRILQNESFEKYGSYSHAAGWLGSVLESAITKLPKNKQEYFNELLQDTINDIVRTK